MKINIPIIIVPLFIIASFTVVISTGCGGGGSDPVDITKLGWAKTFGGGVSEAQNFGLEIDHAGNIYVSGCFTGTVDFGTDDSSTVVSSNGGYDAFLAKYTSIGELVWVKTWGGPGNENVWRIKFDGAGNVYVTGEFEQTVDFDSGTGTDIHISNGMGDCFLAKFRPDGSYVWAITFGGPGGEYGYGLGIAGDRIYVCGYFGQTVDFDPGPQSENIHSVVGELDCFLSSFTLDGNFLGVRTWGGTGNDKVYDIAFDPYGNLFLTGWFFGTVDFNPGPGEMVRTSNGRDDIFLLKLDQVGGFLWVKTWGGTESDGGGHKVVANSLGNIYVTGHFRAAPDFSCGAGTAIISTHGWDDTFVSCFDIEGNFQWVKTWGGVLSDVGFGMDTDSNGNVYVSGQSNAGVEYSALIDDYMPDEEGDIYTFKLNSSGTLLWERTLAGSGKGTAHSVTCDPEGNPYVVGRFRGTFDFDPSVVRTDVTAGGRLDAFILKYLPDGSWE